MCVYAPVARSNQRLKPRNPAPKMRLSGRPTLDYLTAAIAAHRRGEPAPAILPEKRPATATNAQSPAGAELRKVA